MRRPDRTFDTAAEASAFLEGIEFVNDSAITAWIDPANPCAVCVEDEDYNPDDEEDSLAPYTVRHSYPNGHKERDTFSTYAEAIAAANNRSAEEENCGCSDIFDTNGNFVAGRKWNAEPLTKEEE